MERLIGLFRLTFADEAMVEERARGAPVYLMMTMGEDRTVRLKPQNLVTGLPVKEFVST